MKKFRISYGKVGGILGLGGREGNYVLRCLYCGAISSDTLSKVQTLTCLIKILINAKGNIILPKL